MATGTIIMIISLVLLGLLRVFFRKDMDEIDKKYSVYDDPDFDGLDGMSGALGMTTKDLDMKHDKK